MPLAPLYGHEGIRNRLVGAIASGRLPQAILFEGPRGVGKQRLALWLAQTLLCDERPQTGEPCASCQACKLVTNLAHPDVHWLVPIEPPKKAGDADKQVDLAAEALADQMASRRDQPLYEAPSGLANHGIASVRLLLRRMALTPAMGRRKVFIVGDAERLVPQRANPEAANALLKGLEEPPADTIFVLTTSEPDALPATILSRVVRVRVPRLPEHVVTAFVQQVLKPGVSKADLTRGVAAAEGCIGRLLGAEGGGGEGGGAAESFLAGARGRAAPVSRYAFALAQAPFQARGGFTEMLDALLERLRTEARGAVGGAGGAGGAGGETRKLVEAISRVLEAREMAQGNVNPQLLAAVLAEDLAEE